jgi:hypothetical protein
MHSHQPCSLVSLLSSLFHQHLNRVRIVAQNEQSRFIPLTDISPRALPFLASYHNGQTFEFTLSLYFLTCQLCHGMSDSLDSMSLRPRKNSVTQKARYSPPWANTSIIGVAGSSGSGKTSLALAIVASLNLPWVVILSMVYSFLIDVFFENLNRSRIHFTNL